MTNSAVGRTVNEIAVELGWMRDALEYRDQWRSKLLRTASWSPRS